MTPRMILLAALSSVLLLSGAGRPAAQTVTRGPYLGVGAATGVVIRWRTDVDTDSRVRYGTSPDSLTSTADDVAMTREHEIALSGLAPRTTYYYSVGSTGMVLAGGDADHRFRTSPMPGTYWPTRVWIIGDSGLANQNARDVRDAYLARSGSERTDVWLMLGDNAYNTGTDAEYQAAVFDTYPQLLRNTIVWPTRGNHDRIHAGSNNDYYDIFTLPAAGEAGGLASGSEAYYSFDFANIHFVCLDSEGSDRSPGGAMLTWLADDLAATTQDWIIAYWHHPPYTKGSHDSDNTADSGGRMRDMRENALPVLEAGGADLVLTGHSHSYERSFLLDEHYGFSWTLHDSMRLNTGDGSLLGDGAYTKATFGAAPHEGTVYAVAGSSSQTSGGTLNHPVMVTSLNRLGSMVLDINTDILHAVFIDENGVELDEFTIIKGIVPTAVDDRIVATPRLLESAPNPFSTDTRIRYSIPADGDVRLSIFDVKGRRVTEIVRSFHVAGDHLATWDGRSARGGRVPPGVYFSVLEFGGEKRTRKMVFVR